MILGVVSKIMGEANAPPLLQHHAVVLMVSLVVKNGDCIPNLNEIFLELLQSDRTACFALDGMVELMEKRGFWLSREFLDIFAYFIRDFPETNLASQSLELLSSFLKRLEKSYDAYEYLRDYLLFLNEKIGPIILSVGSFNETGTCEAAYLIAYLFVKFENQEYGNCFANYLETRDEALLIDAVEYLTDSDSIPLNPALLTVFFRCLGKREDGLFDFGISSFAQVFLSNMVQQYKEPVLSFLTEMIPNSIDDGHRLRTLCLIMEYETDILSFLPFVESHLNDEFRGDAILCLYAIMENVDSSIELSQSVLESIVPMIEDIDENVRDKVVFVLEEMLIDNFPRNDKWSNYFIRIFRESNEQYDDNLKMNLSKILYSYLDYYENINSETFYEVFEITLYRFLSSKIDDCKFKADLILLEIFIRKMPILNIEQSIPIILQKIKEIIQDSQEYDLNIIELQCHLLDSLIRARPEFMLNQGDTLLIIKQLTDFFLEQTYMFFHDYFWELLSDVIDRTSMLQTEIGEKWTLIALNHFNNRELIASAAGIAKTFAKVIDAFPQEIIEHFVLGAIDIISNNSADPKDITDIVAFSQLAFQLLQQRNALKPELVNIYTQIIQPQTCN